MILKEYIHNAKFEEIWVEFVKNYPECEKDKKGYQKVWIELNSLPIDNSLKHYNIYVDFVHEEEYPEDDYWSVDAWVEGCDYDFAIEYTSWEKWLGMQVDEQTIVNHSKEFVLAHILWEMTWCGFSNDSVKKKSEELYNE